MTHLLSALKSYFVLTLSDLTHIKDTITRRYGHMTSTERAEILSMAVHNHLNKHLVGIDDAHKESLKIAILSNTFAKHHYSITRLTIFDAILDLKLDDTLKTDLAESWLIESAQLSIPRISLENYVVQKRINSETVANILNQTNTEINTSRYNVVDTDALNEIPSIEKIIDVDPYFDYTDTIDRKSVKIPFRKRTVMNVFAILLLVIVIATPAYFVLKDIFQSNLKQDIHLTSNLDARVYKGMSAMGRIYLIDGIDGYKENDKVYLTLEKSRYNFGLMKKTDVFRFANFDYYAVKNYISKTRSGLIGSPEQFNQIIHEAYINDIDPLLLFAIIGQEQGFVPDISSESVKILNNPYNVYHSWADYNTTLRDSTQIAINTIKNRLVTAPFSESPFKWLNETYAEDTNWHNGVRLIYSHLVTIGRTSSIQ